MFKYLFGHIKAVKDEANETEEERFPSRTHGLVITRKQDIYQHVDMAKECRMIPQWGGFNFASLNSKVVGFREFHGESISCRVKTTPETQKRCDDLMAIGNVWMTTHHEYGHLIIAFLEEDLRPADPRGPGDKLVWTKVTLEEACAAMKKEFDEVWS